MIILLWAVAVVCLVAMVVGLWATHWRGEFWGGLLYFPAGFVLAVDGAVLVGRLL